MANWLADLASPSAADRDFAKYRINCALLRPSRTVLIDHLKHDGWQVTASDSTALLLRKPN
jgi:hypothetical protein